MHRIDPRLPLLWRSPYEIQIGFAHPVAVLTNLSAAQEYVVAALHAGVSDVSLRALATQRGMSATDVAELLQRLTPALESAQEPPGRTDPTSVAVDGTGLGAARIAHTLADSSLANPSLTHSSVTRSSLTALAVADLMAAASQPAPPSESASAVVVVVATMALPTERCGLWLRRGVRHLPVVWLDTAVHVGPLIDPGNTACWHCVELTRCDADAARRALVTQVAGRPAATETNLITQDVALRVARWLDGTDTPEAGIALIYNAASGRWHREMTSPHEACSCRTPRGNANAVAPDDDPIPKPPTKGGAAHPLG